MQPDYESIAQGLITKAIKAAPTEFHVSLTQGELSLAAQLPNSPAYQLILKLLEGEIQKLETEHFRSWKNTEQFTNTGFAAVAAQLLYERLQKEVNYHSSEYQGKQEFEAAEAQAEKMSPKEFFEKSFGI